MIYASSSVIVGVPAEKLWRLIKDFLKAEKQGKFVERCRVSDESDNNFIRKILMSDGSEITENVVFIDSEFKAILKLEDHPLLIGDIVLQIVTSSMAELNDRKSTLCGVLSWRMRPGIIEAPLLSDRQDYIEDLLWSIVETV